MSTILEAEFAKPKNSHVYHTANDLIRVSKTTSQQRDRKTFLFAFPHAQIDLKILC